MRNFIAIDFETASEIRTTPVSIGICFVENGEIIREKSFFSLMNPGTNIFNPIAVRKHGITPEMVKDAPLFPEIWRTVLKKAIEENVVVIHSTSAHFSVITQCIALFELQSPKIRYLSTLQIAQKLGIPIAKYSLENLCAYYKIDYKDSHYSLKDAEATAKVALSIMQEQGYKDVMFLKMHQNSPNRTNFEYDNQSSTLDKYLMTKQEISNTDFSGKTFFIHGDKNLDGTIAAIISQRGRIGHYLSKEIDYVIFSENLSIPQLSLVDQLSNSEIKSIRLIPQEHFLHRDTSNQNSPYL